MYRNLTVKLLGDVIEKVYKDEAIQEQASIISERLKKSEVSQAVTIINKFMI